MEHFRGIAVIGIAFFAVTLVLGTALSVRAKEGIEADNEKTQTTEVKDDSPRSQEVESDDDSNSKKDDSEKDSEAAHDAAALRRAAEHAKTRARMVKDRLEGKRLRSCEAHQAAIQRIVKRAGERGDNHIALFSTITQRVEKFYQEKGKTLATYDQLVNEVTAKKAAAQAAVDAVKSAETNFDCNGDNPKALVKAFRSEIKAEIAAIKAYRMSVKNLIVGVKSVQSNNTSDGA